jgi:hypothetical protein
MLGIILFLCATFYGVTMVDLIIDHFVMHQSILDKGATKMTKSHFRQPEKSIFDNDNFSLFLDNVARHKKGVLALKPFYLILLGLYLVLACLVIIKVICTDSSGPPEIGTCD